LNYLDLTKNLNKKNLFKNKEFIKLDKEVLKKINHWLKVRGDFDYKIWQDLFVYDDNENVTNIVEYDWKILSAKRKI